MSKFEVNYKPTDLRRENYTKAPHNQMAENQRQRETAKRNKGKARWVERNRGEKGSGLLGRDHAGEDPRAAPCKSWQKTLHPAGRPSRNNEDGTPVRQPEAEGTLCQHTCPQEVFSRRKENETRWVSGSTRRKGERQQRQICGYFSSYLFKDFKR